MTEVFQNKADGKWTFEGATQAWDNVDDAVNAYSDHIANLNDDPKGKGSEEQATPQRGRPSDFTQDLADKICEELAEGKSLRTVCLADDMPGKATVFRWLRTNEDFRDQYTRAKQEAADALADEILDIADDGSNDYMTVKFGDEEREVLNHEALQRSRLRVDTRKFLMAKMKPKVYGEKLDLTTDGEKINRGASDAELDLIIARRERALANKAGQSPQT